MNPKILLAFLFFILILNLYAFPLPFVIQIWDKVPGAKGNGPDDIPTLTVYLPEKEKNTSSFVIICPGGGYGGLSIKQEGYWPAEWFQSIGIGSAVLKYRIPKKGYRHPSPLNDLQRAIRLVRSKCKDWNITPDRIGIMGGSAGGHLVSCAATHFDEGDAKDPDLIQKQSSRPDFLIMLYPVISMSENNSFTHKGSRYNLLGPEPTVETMEYLSSEKHVTSRTPPTFIVLANDDNVVEPTNSVVFYMALRQAGVPAEIHIFASGSHGFGYRRNSKSPVAQWTTLLIAWMKQLVITHTPGKRE